MTVTVFAARSWSRALPLALGLDGSAVLDNPAALPEGWLAAALDQLFVAAPALTGVTLPWAARGRDEPQALALFEAVQCDYLARDAFWQLPLWLRGERTPARPRHAV